jgi:hypothetical protein
LVVSWGVPATALVEIKPKNSAKLMAPRVGRKERDRGFDWGSRITSSLKDSRNKEKMPSVQRRRFHWYNNLRTGWPYHEIGSFPKGD